MNCIKCRWPKENKKYDYCQACYDRCYSKDIRDYQDMVNIGTPKEVRRKMDIWDVWDNSIKCNECQDVIRSKNRHDYVTCSCGASSVDWWSWYCKRVANNYTSLSVVFLDVE